MAAFDLKKKKNLDVSRGEDTERKKKLYARGTVKPALADTSIEALSLLHYSRCALEKGPRN